MPKIKRWFPVSHNVFNDPEVLEIKEEFGDWSPWTWLWLLSIADQNNGKIRGKKEMIAHSMARISGNTHFKRVQGCVSTLSKIESLGWIKEIKGGYKVRNHNKFHPKRNRRNPTRE